MPEAVSIPDLLRSARAGSRASLGSLLEACRHWLLKAAQDEVGDHLRAKVGASDLVQESIAEALADFDRFEGAGEEELLAWLRQILRHNARDCLRRYRDAEMRDVRREVALPAEASGETGPALADPRRTPEESAAAREDRGRLETALERLPEEYRTVLRLRHQEHLPFEEIGERTGKTANAARKIWARAVGRLSEELGEPP